jgi:ADP-ribose pyrophosphatase YjhB (NUDIX family)
MKHLHPRTDDQGRQVELKSPSQPTTLSSWADTSQIATVMPDGPMPASLNGIALAAWADAPTTAAGWGELARLDAQEFAEPPMVNVPGKTAASGVVVLEDDGRVWVVSPSNGFGGYVNTFPKGTLEPGIGLRANALKEGFEESGLRVVLTGFLCDSVRSTSVTRYYTARRVGGHPADMGWETQAVHLVPRDQLASFVSHQNDQVILQSLQALQAQD